MKWLLVIAVVAAVVWMLTRGRESGHARRPRRPEVMVECAHCGVHLPAADAVLGGDRVYCSEAHRLAGPRRKGSG
jgi:uncharacterized protein